MDLGSCPRTHSVKLKTEYEAGMKAALEEKDEQKVNQLNRLKVDYEQTVSSSSLLPRRTPQLTRGIRPGATDLWLR